MAPAAHAFLLLSQLDSWDGNNSLHSGTDSCLPGSMQMAMALHIIAQPCTAWVYKWNMHGRTSSYVNSLLEHCKSVYIID